MKNGHCYYWITKEKGKRFTWSQAICFSMKVPKFHMEGNFLLKENILIICLHIFTQCNTFNWMNLKEQIIWTEIKKTSLDQRFQHVYFTGNAPFYLASFPYVDVKRGRGPGGMAPLVSKMQILKTVRMKIRTGFR